MYLCSIDFLKVVCFENAMISLKSINMTLSIFSYFSRPAKSFCKQAMGDLIYRVRSVKFCNFWLILIPLDYPPTHRNG